MLLSEDHALAIALGARLHVLGTVASCATAVRADDLTVVRDVQTFSNVELFQGQLDLQRDARTSLLLLVAEAEHVSKRIPLLRRVDRILTSLIILAPLIRVGQNLIGSIDLLELRESLLIAWVFVRMVLKRQLSVSLLDLSG